MFNYTTTLKALIFSNWGEKIRKGNLTISVWKVTIQTKAIEHCFQVALFIALYKVVLTFNSVD